MVEPNEAIIKAPDDWRGVLWRERLREALNITSDLDHRSWRDIKRALAAMSLDSASAPCLEDYDSAKIRATSERILNETRKRRGKAQPS